MAALAILRWFINRQRMVNVYETSLRGPERPVSIGGQRVADLLPVPALAGNVTLSFVVLSYAGAVAVVVVADPYRHPDLAYLKDRFQQQLDALCAQSHSGGRSGRVTR
jgi:diacylglycerol O-acyltransferase